MKKIVVTGATSMIGVALIEKCIANDVKVLAIVRHNSQRLNRLPQSKLLQILECDLEELETIKVQESYDTFYHLAWNYTTGIYRDNPIFQERNIKTALEAVKLAKRLGCCKFVGAGSQAEYGETNQIRTPDTPAVPTTAYGIAKYTAGKFSEKLCRQYGIVHIWGRIFSVYGRNDNTGTMIDYAIDQFMKGETAQFSAATQLWDYLHEKDAGELFFLMGEKVEKNAVYCVASGKSKPLKQYILQMKRCFGEEAKCVFAEESSDLPVFGLQADISTLVQDIGYMPKISFHEGIADVIEYKKENMAKKV